MNHKHKQQKRILWQSLLLTLAIFTIGILLNHSLDAFRISSIADIMQTHEVNTEAYRAEQFFTDSFGGESCAIMTSRIASLKKEIRTVGEDLNSYSRFSFFRKKDYDYLKRKYFLLQLRFFALIEKLNDSCDKPYLSILFFYEIDNDASERQGFVLQELSTKHPQQIVVLSIDKDYEDEPLVDLLVETYGINKAPTLVIDGKLYEGYRSLGEIQNIVRSFTRKADPYAKRVDFMYTPRAAGINTTRLVDDLRKIAENEEADMFARADSQLIIGRLEKNETKICESLDYYDQISSNNSEELALVYETSAALGCGRNRNAFLKIAAEEWKKVGNNYRADLLQRISQGRHIRLKFDEDALKANETVISGYKTPIVPNLPKAASKVTIGSTKIKINEGDTIVSQEDRVFRDWLGGQVEHPHSDEILVSFYERLDYNSTELMEHIGWHEGARIKDIMKINVMHKPAIGTLVAKKNDRWFAVDENGIFRFEVPLDKLYYPTTRFLRRDLAVIVDTHGVNMIVEQAIRHNASFVTGCCDHPGKIYAAKYLGERNISVSCYTDKYVYLAMGHDLPLVGSPPMIATNTTAQLGGREVTLERGDKVVVVNSTDDNYAMWYYQTPASYFDALSQAVELDISYVTLDDFNQMAKVTEFARIQNAKVIAARVFNSNDYEEISNWLDEDEERKVILFHSASYPYGQKLLRTYPYQTSFDDPNPVFE